MDYTVIIRPLIGAVIGYVTNYIAVKMLFRPLKPITIGKFTLPFTPGVIPKNKERIANAIGETISNHLLTEEELSKALLSEEKKNLVYEKVKHSLKESVEDKTLKDGAQKVFSEEQLTQIESKLNMVITKAIVESFIEQNAGRIIATQIELVAKEKVQNSMLRIIGNSFTCL